MNEEIKPVIEEEVKAATEGSADDATPEKKVELTPEERTAKEKAAKRKAFLDNWEPHPERRVFGRKVGRNEKCPCDSGLKFKHCHGKV
jgi:uncharacterized protein YecA (UPF0149 family)